MGKVQCVAVCAWLALATGAVAQDSPTIKVEIKTDANVDDFTGVWTGAWDDRFDVRFTIKPMNSGQRAFVLYEWVERIGNPMQRKGAIAAVEGNVLKHPFIDITRDPADPTKGKAVGNFRTPRTAKLAWSELPPDFLNAATALKRRVTIDEPLETLRLGDAMLYFATNHNFMMYAEKDVNPDDLPRLNDVRISIPQQTDVLLEDALRTALDNAGLKYRVDGRDLRLGFKAAGAKPK
ncbi:MAG: hypothetical protein JNM18_25280 [Planctomycetaceae bacterium]|nr:hypothetical protein [Planctomycetaceae bacterium]